MDGGVLDPQHGGDIGITESIESPVEQKVLGKVKNLILGILLNCHEGILLTNR